MAKHIKKRNSSSRWLYVGAVAMIMLLARPARPAQSGNFVFYFPKTHSILQAKVYQNIQYLPVLKLLNLVGHVAGLQEKRKTLKVWFGSTEIQFHEKNPTVRLNNAKLRLSNPPRTMEGEWMVPVEFLTEILPTLINQTVEYQTGQNRIFIGNVRPNSFTVRMDPLENGAQLTFQFAAPISLRTAARNGRWILYLGSHPVEPIQSNFEFQNSYVSRVQFEDQDGHPKLVLTPSVAGLDFYPKLGNENKTLVADVIQPKAALARPAPALPPPPPPAPRPAPEQPPAAVAARPQAPAQIPNLLLPAVVLDAGHGGADAGAQGPDGLLEKNLTAQIVATVSKALQATGRYRVVLTRTGDQTVDFDQRATEANAANPIAFITFHAGNLGASAPRVMVYTYCPSSPLALASGADPAPPFTPWSKVQLDYLNRSRQLAKALQQDLAKDTGVAAASPMEVPLRDLRSIAAPAVAIEVGSLAPGTNPAPLTQQCFQDKIAAAVVEALENMQGGRS